MLIPYIICNEVEAIQVLAFVRYVMTAGTHTLTSDFTKETLSEIRDQLLQKPTLLLTNLPEVTEKDFLTLIKRTGQAKEILHVLSIASILEGCRDEQGKIQKGKVNKNNLKLVLALANTIQHKALYLTILQQIYDDEIQQAFDTMIMESVNKQFIKQCRTMADFDRICFPYKEKQDLALAERFETLQHLPQPTLGHQFWKLYKKSGYEFPGSPNAWSVDFATFHDTAHLLSGYDTNYRGEIYSVTFNQLSDNTPALCWLLLPFVMCWQLGFSVNSFNNPQIDLIEQPLFWEAWIRGHNIKVNYFAQKPWDFWANVNTPLSTLRKEYGIPPLAKENFNGKMPYM